MFIGSFNLWLVGSAEVVKKCRRFHNLSVLPTSQIGHAGVNEFQEEVNMSNNNANQVHGDRLPQERTEREHNPWQVWSVKGQNPEERHFGFRIATSPYVSHHEGESVSQKMYIGVIRSKRGDANDSENKHPYVVCNSVAKVPFLEKTTVLHLC